MKRDLFTNCMALAVIGLAGCLYVCVTTSEPNYILMLVGIGLAIHVMIMSYGITTIKRKRSERKW